MVSSNHSIRDLQCEWVKENTKCEEKKDTRKCKQIKEKPGAKWSTESGDLRARPHPAKLPICEKE